MRIRDNYGNESDETTAALARDMAADLLELHTELKALRVDFIDLRTQYLALLAKLDLDGGVTDTNYAALVPPAALTVGAVADLTTVAV